MLRLPWRTLRLLVLLAPLKDTLLLLLLIMTVLMLIPQVLQELLLL